jgi:LmbE family N-acetylglucosaminyl deacetylase
MRMWLLSVPALAALALGACGDNVLPDGEPLAPATDLTIIAHQDDDLIFLQPDLYDAVQRRTGVTNVYVTAGNGNHGVDAAEARYGGLMAAYGAIAGDDDWSCGWIEIAGHAAEHCRLAAEKVSLVFLGYPDGGRHGEVTDSLLHLWEGKVTTVSTIARRPTTYDQRGLIATLAAILDTTAPATLRTLEIASTHGDDHPDHMVVGALATLATAASAQGPELISYRGYDLEHEPANKGPILARSLGVLAYYEACATGCAPCGEACAVDRIAPSHLTWIGRRYAIGMRRAVAGKLRLGGGCVTAASAGGNAAIGACATAPTWQLDDRGALRSSTDLCLEVIFTGEIITGACGNAGPGARFFLDDEGHLWSGVVPAPEDDMTFAHLDCVGAAGGRPRAGLCGADHAPTLELTRTAAATPRAATTITRGGRAVRLARLAPGPLPMLCAIEPGGRGLVCAPGTPDGGLAPAVRIDDAAAPLAIEPESLTFGDVDGDGLTDACGRDAGGLLCATAASGWKAARWATVLASSGPAGPADRSLAIAPDGTICGLADPGVVCVAKGQAALTDVRSTWPDRRAALWIADLDGDRRPDWCAATPEGPACSLAADRALTTDGVPWGYASGGVVEASAVDGTIPDTATAAVTDIDGDGRDDLCTAQDGVIACARSLGHGFGPRTSIARLPDGMIPTSVWAEPAGPGLAGRAPRICAADATTIACAD